MTNDKSGAHANVKFLVSAKLLGHKRSGRLRDRLKSLDEEAGDARDELHDRTHLDAEAESRGNIVNELLHIGAREASNNNANYDTEEKGFAKEAELLLHALGVYINLINQAHSRDPYQ